LAEQRRQQQVGDVNGIASSVASIATGLPMGGAATTAPAAGQDLLSMASPEDSALESINAMGIS
jgi:hypothetical protein